MSNDTEIRERARLARAECLRHRRKRANIAVMIETERVMERARQRIIAEQRKF